MREIFPCLEPRLHIIAIAPGRKVRREDWHNAAEPASDALACSCRIKARMYSSKPCEGSRLEALRYPCMVAAWPPGTLMPTSWQTRQTCPSVFVEPMHASGPARRAGCPQLCEETFSLVTREALQAGLPVIAAKRGALPAVIQDGVNGLLFEPENADDLRRCLERLARTAHARPIRDPQAYAQDL